MASAHAHHEQHSASQQQQRFVSSEQHEEAVREMEQIRHTNATLDVGGSDSFRAQTEQAAIRIVTPHYKIPDKPGTDVRLGQSAADLTHKFAEANGADYKAERSQEHFRMQIIDPKVVSNALVPGHAIRDYARRHLIDDFPSLHGKRSFLDLDAMEQLRLRRQGNLGAATDRDKDLEKYLKNRDGRRWDLPPPPKVEDESLREFDRLRQNIDHLQKARSIPRVERSVVRVEPPAPLPQRKQIVEVRREIIKVPAAVKHTVHRIEEKKRTEEVERRVVRRERRHKSRRLHRSHHSSSAAAAGGHQQEYHYGSWAGGGGGGGGGYRSSSASRRSGYTNGFGGHHGGGEHHLMPIAYEGSRSAASDRYFGGGAGRQMNGGGGQHARYGSVSDSLRRGDLKYGPNGELLVNGSGNVKHHRVHKAHSTRDVFYHGDGGRGGDGADSHYSSFQRRGGGAEPPFVEFPPTLDRRSDWSGGQPEPPPHHRRQFADEYAGSGGVHQLTKARSFADWEEGGGRGRAQFGSRHDEDMARLEHEFRDARLMRIPSGNMQEKEHHHREIPGGYETYSRETKAHSDRKVDGVPVAATGQPTGTEVNVPVGTVGGVTPLYRSREASQDFGSRRDGQK